MGILTSAGTTSPFLCLFSGTITSLASSFICLIFGLLDMNKLTKIERFYSLETSPWVSASLDGT